MDYHLHLPPPAERQAVIRVIPPRHSASLRRGGGRKSSPGWTEQKRRTNRRRFDRLRPFIKTAVTVIYPASATPAQLAALDACNRNFCKEKSIPARAVWEGPGYHQHIALGIPHSAGLETLWLARLRKRWMDVFGREIAANSFLWKPDIEPDKIASYLSKTRKNRGICVKCPWPWMPFAPCWEVGFRILVSNGSSVAAMPKPRKKRVSSTSLKTPHHSISPSYTVKPGQTSETKREIAGDNLAPTSEHRLAPSKARSRAPAASSAQKSTLAAPASDERLSPMKAVTLQQFGQDLSSWLALVQQGEAISIVDDGREVARLLPAVQPASRLAVPVQWPDFAARPRTLFGEALLSAGIAQALIDKDRVA